MLLFPIDVPQLEKWVSFIEGLPQDLKIPFRVANAHAVDLNAAAPLSLDGWRDIRTLRSKQSRSAVFRSGGEIGHQLYKEFGAGKLDCVDFQSVPTDEAQGAGYGFWRLEAARAAQEQTQARGPNADAEKEDGELDLRKRIFTLFLPNVGDHGGKAGQQSP